MLRRALITKLYHAAYMQRWNDRLRPVELIELDKQAHKMITAYFLGKFEEHNPGFDWIEIIEGGIFEMLQRVVLTDIKPPVFYKIKADKDKYQQLNQWIFSELKNCIEPVGNGFAERFKTYLLCPEENINRRILGAAHIFSTNWEFNVIEKFNRDSYDIEDIRHTLTSQLEQYSDLEGMKQLMTNSRYRNFLDLCGQLRFQYRWSNLYKSPKTAVLGHMLMVALFAYFFSQELGACKKRSYNNFFTGLFHDLPEVLTRDIISPVKKSVEGLKTLIQEYEKEQMEKEVYRLIPDSFRNDLMLFTEHEFDDVALIDGEIKTVSSEEINEQYNNDIFSPRDGKLLKAADELSAYLEASEAIKNGSSAQEFHKVKVLLSSKYEKMQIAGLALGQIFGDFE